MAIRVLLAPLFHVIEDDRRALDAAFVLAKQFQGHVDALLVQPDPADAVPLVGEGVSAETIRKLMEGAASVIEQQQQVVSDLFQERAACPRGFRAAPMSSIQYSCRPPGRSV